jgi:hypothetical protein
MNDFIGGINATHIVSTPALRLGLSSPTEAHSLRTNDLCISSACFHSFGTIVVLLHRPAVSVRKQVIESATSEDAGYPGQTELRARPMAYHLGGLRNEIWDKRRGFDIQRPQAGNLPLDHCPIGINSQPVEVLQADAASVFGCETSANNEAVRHFDEVLSANAIALRCFRSNQLCSGKALLG